MFSLFKSKEYRVAKKFFDNRQKILTDFMKLKNKVSPEILSLQVAKNTGIIVTSLDHSVKFGDDASDTLSPYRKKLIAALFDLCENKNKHTTTFDHAVKVLRKIEKDENLSKQTVSAVETIVQEFVNGGGNKVIDSIFEKGINSKFFYNVLSYMSDEQFALRMSALYVIFPYGKQLTLDDVYLGLCSLETFEDYTILFMNKN
jgi:hypothetical protein